MSDLGIKTTHKVKIPAGRASNFPPWGTIGKLRKLLENTYIYRYSSSMQTQIARGYGEA